MRVGRTAARAGGRLAGVALLVGALIDGWLFPGRHRVPLPADARHETTDASVVGVISVAVGLVVALGVALVGVSLVFVGFTARPLTLRPPAAGIQNAGGYAPTPKPELSPDPMAALAAVRAEEAERLHGYAWVDRGAGVVRIPIERAMDLVAGRGVAPAEKSP